VPMAANIVCPDVTVQDQDQCVRFPGGATLCVQVPQVNPDQFQIAKNLLTQANSALAPLAPLFSIIDAILAVKAVIDAIPDSLGPPPDPTALAQTIPELAKKVAALAALIPQLSVPLLVVDTIDVVLAALNGILEQLTLLQEQQGRINAALVRAALPGDGALAGVAGCAQDVLNAQIQALQAGTVPINSLLAVVNVFLGLVGLDPLAPLNTLPDDPALAVAQLEIVVDVLTKARNAIPIP
jgi:hypothetical protein